ncbi:MAG: SGNH/GDSL hydrolase family protein [Planctomycetota bacterium]
MTDNSGSRGAARQRSRARAIGWAVIAAVNLACALGIYLAVDVRVFDGGKAVEPVVPRVIGRFDPWLGWALIPGAKAVSHRLAPPVEYRINSKGLRSDQEHDYRAPDAIRRVVLLGDSNTFGFGVPIEAHFSSRLERLLEPAEIINLGVSAFGIDQELLSLRYEGLRYGPDLVIAYIPHYGDFRHMYRRRFGRGKPCFRYEAGGLQLVGSPVGAPNEPIEAGDEIETDDPHFGPLLQELGNRIVEEMHRVTSAAGASFLLVTKVPSLVDFARDVGMPVLDVRAAMAAPELKLPEGLGHMNAAGNQALAAEIAGFVRRRNLLAASSRPERRSGLHIALRVSAASAAGAATTVRLWLDGEATPPSRPVTAPHQRGEWEWVRFDFGGRALPRRLTIAGAMRGDHGAELAPQLWVSVIEVNGVWLRPGEGRVGGRPGPVRGRLAQSARLEFDLAEAGLASR